MRPPKCWRRLPGPISNELFNLSAGVLSPEELSSGLAVLPAPASQSMLAWLAVREPCIQKQLKRYVEIEEGNLQADVMIAGRAAAGCTAKRIRTIAREALGGGCGSVQGARRKERGLYT